MNNKIYNNLTVENLVKTEWFNQFDKTQQNEILKGFLSKVDISKYAKKEYDWLQMAEIREGLESNLDVSIYANPEISITKMRKIKEKLLRKKNSSSKFDFYKKQIVSFFNYK